MSVKQGYGKHYGSMYEGSMVGAGSLVFAVMGYVIAKAYDSHVELNPTLVAAIIGESVDDVKAAIAKLEEPDPNSRNQEHDGKRLVHVSAYAYYVPSWEFYRDAMRNEERRVYLREKKRESRARSKGQQGSTGSTMSTPSDSDSDSDPDPPKPPKGSDGGRGSQRRSKASKGSDDPGQGSGADRSGESKRRPAAGGSEGFEARCRQYARDPFGAELEHGPLHKWPGLNEIAAEFDRICDARTTLRPGHPGAKAVVDMVAAGVTRDELRAAFQGAAKDPHLAKNPQFRQLQTVLRDPGQLDKYRALRDAPADGEEPRRSKREQNEIDERQWAQAREGVFGERFKQQIASGEIRNVRELRDAMRGAS